jgi:hypothetical protein
MPGDIPRRRGVPRRITGFHQDEEQHWVADLVCGHTQHVRHIPPWQNRPWVVSPEGRREFLGRELMCVDCLRAMPGTEKPVEEQRYEIS